MACSNVRPLTDSKLSIRWFDPQGCIESEAFDILKEPPLLVLQAMIFQRFDAYLLGLTQKDETKVELGNKTYYLERAHPRFQLHGRHAYTTPAHTEPKTSDDKTSASNAGSQANGNLRRSTRNKPSASTPQPQPQPVVSTPALAAQETPDAESPGEGLPPPPKGFFFKSSWAECGSDKEPEIIRVAYERANKYLPENCRKMVTNHLPVVEASKECGSVSTLIIRLFMKQAGGLSEISEGTMKKQARVQILMVTKKLLKVTDVPDAYLVWKGVWEINRCMPHPLVLQSLILTLQ